MPPCPFRSKLPLEPLWKTEKGWEAGGGRAAEDNSSQSLGSCHPWVTKSTDLVLCSVASALTIWLFIGVLHTRSSATAAPLLWVPPVQGAISVFHLESTQAPSGSSSPTLRGWEGPGALCRRLGRLARLCSRLGWSEGVRPSPSRQDFLGDRGLPSLPPSAPPFRPCPLPGFGPAPVTPGGWRHFSGLRAALREAQVSRTKQRPRGFPPAQPREVGLAACPTARSPPGPELPWPDYSGVGRAREA